MDGYDIFRQFVSLRHHFTLGSNWWYFDQPQVPIKREIYEKRPEKYACEKIAKLKDPFTFMIAILSECPVSWIGDLNTSTADKIYLDFQGKLEALMYTIQSELPKVDTLEELFKHEKGKHPLIVREWLGGRISLLTLTVINKVLHFADDWVMAKDPLLHECWERISKLDPFIQCDLDKVSQIINNKYEKEDFGVY